MNSNNKIVENILREALGNINEEEEFEDELTGEDEIDVAEEEKVVKTGKVSNVKLIRNPASWRKYTDANGVQQAYKTLTFLNLATNKACYFNVHQGKRTTGYNFEENNKFDLNLIEALKKTVPRIDALVIKGVSVYYKGKNWMSPTPETQIMVVDGKTKTLKLKI